MNNKEDEQKKAQLAFSRQVGLKEARKLKARQTNIQTVWYGLGMMGLIGWSVAIPTFLGVGIGLWLDNTFPIGESWTLILLVAGLCIGCLNAWRWLKKEDQKIRDNQEKKDE